MPEHNTEAPSTSLAIRRGFLGKCPNCGKGKLFKGFLAEVEHCEVCDEPLSQYDPDLLLALSVGLVVVAAVALVYAIVETNGGGSPVVYLTLLFPVTAIVSVVVLRPFKGALTGYLWVSGIKAGNN